MKSCEAFGRVSRKNITLSLTNEELTFAEKYWIRAAQREKYADEVQMITQSKTVVRSSKLFRLQPILDEHGLLRVDGRLKLAKKLPRDARELIILPRKHRITWLIIYYYHQLLYHKGGINHTLSNITQFFWIVRAREAVKEVCYNCSLCLRNSAQAQLQVMAPLPDIHINASLRAFAHTGLDYAGPFITQQGQGRVQTKRYLCLFTCFSSRAVHLEMAWSLDTDSFLEVLSRMIARRGKPEKIVSDNGTNFTSAEREIRQLVAELDQERIMSKTANMGVKWIFNPSGAPHFGGIFESMVKSAKKAITAILGNAIIKDEELLTSFTIAEGLINSRPLTYQGTDPKDNLPLTPNHFLFGQAGGELAPDYVDFDNFNPRRRWYLVQQLMGSFWKRWMREILPTLNPRNKWNTIKDDLSKGDIVLCIESSMPRGKWPMGRVTETNKGDDGHIRVAKVLVAEKEVIRPISRRVWIQKSTE